MKIFRVLKNLISLSIIMILFVSTIAASTTNIKQLNRLQIEEDFDPLVDVEVSVEIKKIRAFDKKDIQFSIIPYYPIFYKSEYIDKTDDPDFYIKVIINGQEFTSDIWLDTKYIYDPQWSATCNVPDDEEFVDITIQLWDWNNDGDVLCDIGDENNDVHLIYNIKTGHWTGDDQIKDPSGYGRLNGCDDGSIYQRDKDCELWFDIFQNDYDNDGIPYWIEVNEYGTDPMIDNSGEDSDNDDVPIEWEWKWEYNPVVYNNHQYIDFEDDGIDNYEEYLTSEWYSDPYRKDLFIELDQMEQSFLPDGAKELLYTAHDRQNIVYHLDDGSWNNSSSDILPFDETTEENEFDYIYYQYFLNGDQNNWRRGVFHYGLVVHQSSWIDGNAFGRNWFQISSNGMEERASSPILDRDVIFASAYMHETGHTLGFRPIPGHDYWSRYPWQIGWWFNRPYKSCMNYGYMYWMVDYSDGSRNPPDLDDWERMDLTYFQGYWD